MVPESVRTRRILRPTIAALALTLVAGGVLLHAGTALVVSRPIADPDAIVSLASHEWERLPEAAAQAARFPRAVVLLTLPAMVNAFNCHDCANRTRRLASAGVPSDRIRIVPLEEGGTYGEALAVKRWALSHRSRRVLVVTSPYHTRRSLATFRAALGPEGVEVGVAPASPSSPARPERWWSAPYDRAYVAYEWAGMLYYALRFRLA